MTVRLLVNENFPVPALRMLRERGLDVMAIIETMPAASDEAVLAVAREEERWLVTFDRDYGELVFSSNCPRHPRSCTCARNRTRQYVPPPSC